MSEKLAEKLIKIKKKSRGIRITVKFQNFRLTDKSIMLTEASSDPDIIFRTACELFNKVKIEESIRLVGVSVKDLVGENTITSKPDIKPIDSFFSNHRKNDAREQINKSKDDLSPDKVSDMNVSSINAKDGLPRFSEEDLEKELDDLEAIMTERLDTDQDRSIASNRNTLLEVSLLKDVSDRANLSMGSIAPRNTHTNPIPNRKSDQPSIKSSRPISSSKKSKPRVMTLHEQFRNTLAGNAISSKDPSDASETNTPKARVPELMHCPICNKEISTYGFLSRLNKHIDECLIPKKSRPLVDPSVVEIETPMKEAKKASRKQVKGLDGFFSSIKDNI